MFLNVMVADSFDRFAEQFEAAGPERFQETLQALLRRVFRKHERVIFNGDGYSADWAAEAARRGLPNLRSTPEAIAPLLDPANQALVAKYGVLSKVEMDSRYEVALEEYERKVGIEGGIALEIARSMVLPVATDAYSAAAGTLGKAVADGLEEGVKGLRAQAATLGRGLDDLVARCAALEKALAVGSAAKTLAAMAKVRETVDALEHVVDDASWPLPKYREMLFLY